MNKREKQYSDSAQLTFMGFVGMLAVVIWTMMTDPDPAVTNPQLEDWLDGTEETLLDTMRAIIPEGKGVIEYPDGTKDSIWYGREGKSEYGQYQESDEYRMWIGANGDTIWE